MADDQATLGTFTDGDGSPDGDESDGDGSSAARVGAPCGEAETPKVGGSTEPAAAGADGAATTSEADGSTIKVEADLVCPWCLAAADRFVEAGLSGLACGRCSAVLPVDADWFRERDVVARRPLYAVDEEGR